MCNCSSSGLCWQNKGPNHQHHHSDNGAPTNLYPNHRGSPGFWEPPPPPTMPYSMHWEPPHYWNYHGASREELRMLDFHRRQQQHDAYRYGSSGTLSSSHQELYANGGGGGGCCGGGGRTAGQYMPPLPPIGCCSYDPRVSGPIPWIGGGGQVRI